MTFSGSANDPEDGDLTASLAWSSDLDGAMGTGASFTTSALSIGTHTITASVTDSLGATGSHWITLTVNGPPSVTITAPAEGSSTTEGADLTLTASVVDEDDLAASLTWTSSLDGPIGTGASVTTAALSIGLHTLTASVTDSRGLPGSDTITVTVNTNATPTVSITAPADGTTEDTGTSVTFSGSASDPEDGDLTASLTWSSD